MADQKVTDMTELLAPTIDDALYVVDDADGTPLSRRITLASLFKMQGSDGLADDTYYGFTISNIAAGENIAQWALVYLDDTENEWMNADADATGKWPARGIAVEAGTNGNAISVLVFGVVRNDGWTWTGNGKTLYLSDSPGAITETAPSGSGDCIQVVGFSLSDDEAFFNFTGVYAEHA